MTPILIDTQAFLFELMDDRRSTPTAIRVLQDGESKLLFSMVSLWEIAIKLRLGKLQGLGRSVAVVREAMEEYGMELVPIEFEDLLEVERMPLLHHDPFDRLLIAQAVRLRVPVLSADRVFAEYGVPVVW